MSHLKDRVKAKSNEKKDWAQTGVLESTVVHVLVVRVAVSIVMHLLIEDQLSVYNQLISKCRDSLMWFKMPVPHHSLPERQILSSYPGDYVWNSTLIYTFQKLSEVHPGVLGISGCLSSSLTSSLWASCSCFKGNIKVTISRIFKPESGGQLAQWWGWVRSRGRRSRARLEKLFPLHTLPSRHRAPFSTSLNKRSCFSTIGQRYAQTDPVLLRQNLQNCP